jgi:LacI family transcriptional regulator
VSRVLNGKDVDEDMTRRVREVVDELGYRPNQLARSLRTRTAMSWALVIPDIQNPFFNAIVRGAEDVAREAGYSLMLANTDEDPEREAAYFEAIVDSRAAGVLLIPASERETPVDYLLERGIPVVALDRHPQPDDIDSVLVDNPLGARLATERLLAVGCERIACITGPLQTTTGAGRLEGYRAALAEAGREVDEALVEVSDFREEGGYTATMELLALDEPPDGYFVANNLMAVGALEAFTEQGVEVPGDVKLVSFDDIPFSRLFRPRLTAAAQPTYEMGNRAARLLLRRIQDPDAPVEHVVLEPTLVVRESA